MPSLPPRVLISYSHDSRDHMDRVLALADRLRGDGIDAQLDQYEVSPPKGWQLWMEDEIEAADFVLVVATETYERRRRGHEEQGKGHGVHREAAILSQQLYDTLRNETCIPVVLEAADAAHVPVFLKAFESYDLSTPEVYESLYRRLTRQPAVRKPELGKLKELAPRPRRQELDAAGELSPTPSYTDGRTQELAQALEAAYQRHEELTTSGGDPEPAREEILKLKRRIREGGRLKPGDFLADGRFRLLEPLGKGGFSTVFKAYDRTDRQLVAVKVLHGQYAEDRSRRERFFRGARKMAQLQHQGIVRVTLPQDEEGGYHYFVMEHVAGGDLRQAVQEGRLGGVSGLAVLRQVAEALAFAHRQGVIHRDVKPANILLGPDGGAKLTDFDLVRALDTTGGTRTGSMLGTFLYVAPEALELAKTAGTAADVYSLAMTAGFVLNRRELPSTVLRDPSAFIQGLEAPEAVKQALVTATSWEPEQRQKSVEDLWRALEQGSLTEAGKSARPSRRKAAAPKAARKRRASPSPASSSTRSFEELEKTVAGLQDWKERCKVYESLPGQFDDPLLALDAVHRLRLRTRDGNDLFFLEQAARAVGKRWPKARDASEQLQSRLYDHVPPPPEELFRQIETRDGQVDLWREVPAGTFLMGSLPKEKDSYDHERPQHEVVVRSPFQMAAVPVTVAQYAAFDPDHRSYHRGKVADEHLASHPVESVTWYQAFAFCRWLSATLPWAKGARLPTEEEWEYACRAGTQTRYWKGDKESDLAKVGWYNSNSQRRTHRAGRKLANPWGLYDVHGNVWEWTLTEWTDDYSGREGGHEVDPQAIDPARSAEASGGARVFRGGCCWNEALVARSAYRFWYVPESAGRNLGFRVVLPAAPSDPRS